MKSGAGVGVGMLKFCSLSSGSSGNCYYIASEKGSILVDAGISRTRVVKSLQHVGERIENINAIFVTHEHSDHIKGLDVLVRKHGLNIYATKGTIKEMVRIMGSEIAEHCFPIEIGKPVRIGDMTIDCHHVSHDAVDPVCYKVSCDDGACVGIITDLGWADPSVVESFQQVDLLLLESNHDVELLKIGPYPSFLKKRILSKEGHLSNDSAGVIAKNILSKGRLKYLILGHLSEVNNHPDLAFETVRQIVSEAGHTDGRDYELDVSLHRQVGKMYYVKKTLIFLFFLLSFAWTGFFSDPLYADEELLREQVKYDIPVLGVVVVENGEVKTYVSRKLSEGVLSDHDHLFQAGSIAQVTTTLALMELLREKEISFYAEIAGYLGIPAEGYEGITFQDVFLHTTGFLNSRYRTLSEHPYSTSLRERAASHLEHGEKRFSVGEFSIPSNHHFAVMTLLMEQLSGKSFPEAMRAFFLNLGMRHSDVESAEETLTPRYYVAGGEMLKAEEYHALLPASDDFVTNLTDMQKLLLYLTDRNLPKSFKVFSKVYTNINDFNARSTVFQYRNIEGLSVYLFDSALPGACERLLFIPNKRVGMFIYYNSDDTHARDAITRVLLADYLEGSRLSEVRTIQAHNQSALAGYYKPVNISDSNLEAFWGFSHQIKITSVGNDLFIDDNLYSPVSETIYYSRQAQKYARFVTNEYGGLRYLFLDNEMYERSFSSNTQLLLLGLLTLISSTLSVMTIIRWRSLIAGRVDDRPRVWLLFAQLLFLVNMGLVFFVVRNMGYWAIAYGGGTSAVILRYFGWSILPAIILEFFVLLYTRGDYKWRGSFRLLIWLSLPLSMFFLFWLITYRLIAFF